MDEETDEVKVGVLDPDHVCIREIVELAVVVQLPLSDGVELCVEAVTLRLPDEEREPDAVRLSDSDDSVPDPLFVRVTVENVRVDDADLDWLQLPVSVSVPLSVWLAVPLLVPLTLPVVVKESVSDSEALRLFVYVTDPVPVPLALKLCVPLELGDGVIDEGVHDGLAVRLTEGETLTDVADSDVDHVDDFDPDPLPDPDAVQLLLDWVPESEPVRVLEMEPEPLAERLAEDPVLLPEVWGIRRAIGG
jgi:hypothetical protein